MSVRDTPHTATIPISQLWFIFKYIQVETRLELRATRPGETEGVSAYTGSLDLPKTSDTMHSHLRERPMSSNRNLYEQERCDGNGSKDLLFPVSVEMNLQQPIKYQKLLDILYNRTSRSNAVSGLC